MQRAGEMANAVVDCRPQRRATGPLAAEHTIRLFSPIILPSVHSCSGHYRQQQARRRKKRIEAA